MTNGGYGGVKGLINSTLSDYINIIRLTAITTIPPMQPRIIVLLLSYSRAIGISSSIAIYTIIPAISPKIIPYMVPLRKGRRTR